MSGFTVQVDGLPALIRRLREDAGAATVLRKAFTRIGLEAMSASKGKAPVDTGLLRNRITYQVDSSPLPTFVRIGTIGGTSPGYAAFMEYGTGLVHDHPSWPHKRHLAPGAALEGWGKRTGRSPYAVARAITKRGGLRPRRYLRGPFELNQRRYVRTLSDALRGLSFG